MTRAILAEELGIVGKLEEFSATIEFVNDVAIVRIGAIRGRIENPLSIRAGLERVARAEGARRLRVEARLANPRLLTILLTRYGFVSGEGLETLEVEFA